MKRNYKYLVLPIIIFMMTWNFSGCITVPFEIAGDLIGATGDVVGATGDVVGAVVSVPIDVAGGIVDGPPRRFGSHVSETRVWTKSADGVECIELDFENGSVDIRGSERTDIYIHAVKEVHARSQRKAEEYLDDQLIHVDYNREILQISKTPRHESDDNYYVQIHFEIEIPYVMDLAINTHNASIGVYNVYGSMKTVTHNGRISIEKSKGALCAKTHNGDIRIESVDLIGDGRLITHNGSVRAEFTEIQSSLDVESHNGKVSIFLPYDFNGFLDARNDNGHITSDYPVRITTSSDNQLTGQIGDGYGPKVDIKAQNGSIELKKLDD